VSEEDRLLLQDSHYEHLDRMHQPFVSNDIDNSLAKDASNYVVASFEMKWNLKSLDLTYH